MLRTRLETAEFAQKVTRQTKVRIPVRGDEIVADYTFQNGRRNLVRAKDFDQSRPGDVMREVEKTAVEGHLLFKHPDAVIGGQQLVIVGSFGPAGAELQSTIEELLKDHEVELFTEQSVDALVQRIRETAH